MTIANKSVEIQQQQQKVRNVQWLDGFIDALRNEMRKEQMEIVVLSFFISLNVKNKLGGIYESIVV